MILIINKISFAITCVFCEAKKERGFDTLDGKEMFLFATASTQRRI
jgi:hypothetical protein